MAAGGHGPFAGAADTVYSMVDRVDQSLQPGMKASPLEAALEPPAGTPNAPVPHRQAILAGTCESCPDGHLNTSRRSAALTADQVNGSNQAAAIIMECPTNASLPESQPPVPKVIFSNTESTTPTELARRR